eukprot:14301782-Ditylum_brightwellii.AAC.2
MNCDDPLKKLSVLINLAGDVCQEYEHRKKSSICIANRTKKTSISTKNEYRLCQNIWLPSVQYPLAITLHTKMQCINIMKTFVRDAIPKLGFNCNTARKILFDNIK